MHCDLGADPRHRFRHVRAARIAVACATLLAAFTAALAADTISVGRFSSQTAGSPLPSDWTPLTFRNIGRHTDYSLVADAAQGTVVRADARASASGLMRRLDLDAHAHPLLRWRWKVARPIAGGDVTRKDGDDYAARIYVSFRYAPERLSLAQRARYAAARLVYGEYPPHAGLNYIWDARASVGTVVANPYTDRVRMIVVESGAGRAGSWLGYERDIVADYRAAFGEDPPPIAGIAIMTDSDNTGDAVEAWYGDIDLSARNSGAGAPPLQGSVTPSVNIAPAAPNSTNSEQ
jgi:hypothetical protein